MTSPTLSIVSPIKNEATYLPACLASVANARAAGLALEHIVVEGGSTDGTRDLLAAQGDVQVFTEPHLNTSQAVEFGIAKAQGDFILLLMGDDELSPDFVKLTAPILKSGKTFDVAVFACQLVGEPPDESLGRHLSPPRRAWDVLTGYPGANSSLIRRDLLATAPFPKHLPSSNDRPMMLHILTRAPQIVICDDSIVNLRAHDGSRTNSSCRDVLSLKREAQTMATDFTAGAEERLCPHISALWAWRTALSLCKEHLLSGSNERISIVRRIAGDLPPLRTLPSAIRGLSELLRSTDSFAHQRSFD